MNELEEKLKGKKIKFISVSIDRNQKAWLNWVKDNKLKGIQLHTRGDQTLSNAFNIRGIPRFILLGKNGEVIQSNTYRPTQTKELHDLITNLKGL